MVWINDFMSNVVLGFLFPPTDFALFSVFGILFSYAWYLKGIFFPFFRYLFGI